MQPVVSHYALKGFSRIGSAAAKGLRTLLLSSALLATGASGRFAQTVTDDDNVDTQQLNLPKDVTIFGKSDPNVRKATAIVNGRIITGTDFDQRLALFNTANGGTENYSHSLIVFGKHRSRGCPSSCTDDCSFSLIACIACWICNHRQQK